MFHDYDKARMMGALSYTAASLHTSYPGTTGANEMPSTSGYVRQTPALAAYSGGVRTIGAMTWQVPAATVKWIGLWSGANFAACCPNGANPKEFYVTASTFTCPAHGYVANQTVTFYGDTPPAPLVAGTTYYVVNPTTDTFQVAAAAAGAAITLTTIGATGCQVSAIYEDVYAAPGPHTISTTVLGLPL